MTDSLIEQIETQIKFEIINEDVPINTFTYSDFTDQSRFLKVNRHEKTVLSLANISVTKDNILAQTDISNKVNKSWNICISSESKLLILYPQNNSNEIQIIKGNIVYDINLYNESNEITKVGEFFSTNKEYQYKLFFETKDYIVLLNISKFDTSSKQCIYTKDKLSKLEFKEFINSENKMILYPGINYFTESVLYMIVTHSQYVRFPIKHFTSEENIGLIFHSVKYLFKNIFFVSLKRGLVFQYYLLLNEKAYHIENSNTAEGSENIPCSFDQFHGIVFYYSYKEDKLKLIKLTKHNGKRHISIFESTTKDDHKTPIELEYYYSDPVILDLDSEEENSFVVPLTGDYEEQSLLTYIMLDEKFYFLTTNNNLYECRFLSKNKNERSETEKADENTSIMAELTHYFKKFEARGRTLDKTEIHATKIKQNIDNLISISSKLGPKIIENKLGVQNQILENLLENLNIRNNTCKKENILITNIKKIYKLLLYKLNFLDLKTELENYCKYYNKYVTMKKTVETKMSFLVNLNLGIKKTVPKENTKNLIIMDSTPIEGLKKFLYDVLKSKITDYDEIISLKEEKNKSRSYKNIFGDYLQKKKPEPASSAKIEEKISTFVNIKENEKTSPVIDKRSIDTKPGLFDSFKQPIQPNNANIVASTPVFGAGLGAQDGFGQHNNHSLDKGKHAEFVFAQNSNQQIMDNNSTTNNTNFFNINTVQDANTNVGWLGSEFNPTKNPNSMPSSNNNTENFFNIGQNNNSNDGNNTGNQMEFSVDDFRK